MHEIRRRGAYYAADTAVIVGDVQIGKDSSIWHHCVLRGDVAPIRVGDRTNVQDGAILHTKLGVPLEVGSEVVVGHNAVVHGKRVGDRTLIGIQAVILDDCQIGEGCLIAAGTVLPPGTIVPEGSLVMGAPGKVVRPEGECTLEEVSLREYANPNVKGASFRSSDPRLERLFEAGRETFRQNAVDVFMDCPSRERAGWLCDSFFTARVAQDLGGDTALEGAMMEDFLLPEKFEFLSPGMLPMCYPADHNDGVFIPNWAMWFVVQLEVVEDSMKDSGKIYDFPACYYRFHLEAPVRFRSSIRCGIEHGGVNDTDSQYASLAFYYVRDRVGLAQTNAVAFSGPGVETLENFFEGDDDDVAVKCAILKTKEPVERVLAIDPANAGVRLRRTLDQSLGPQRADVTVDGAAAGAWYDPDRNPFKRLAESDFELAPALVRGKSSIKVTFTPRGGAWTVGELRALAHVDRPLLESPGKAN